MLHISVPAERIFTFFSFPITNSLLVTWLVMASLVVFSLYATHNLRKIPSGVQNFTELLIEGLLNFFEQTIGKNARIFFPLVATFFIFIILGNWSSIIPGFGSIGFWEEVEGKHVLVPLFRRNTADLNTTFALALVSFAAIQYFGLKHVRLSYLKKFLNPKDPLSFFVGPLELISEFAKIISFSFRLFGNMFAGEVLITVVAVWIPFILPLPFLFLEIFVGFIQAFIFSMLTLVFLNMAVSFEKH